MPIYEYQCEQCGEIEEALQKFSDKPLKKCKHCSGKLHKFISQSAFHLKGSGWYVTDYANKTPNKKNKTNETGASKKDTAKEAKSPAKSVPKKANAE